MAWDGSYADNRYPIEEPIEVKEEKVEIVEHSIEVSLLLLPVILYHHE